MSTDKKTPESPVTPKSASTTVELPSVSCTLEVDDGRCGNFLWNPTLEVLRGRISRYNTPGNSLPNRFMHVPDIFGMRLWIDVVSRRCSIYDPYSLPSLEPQLKAINDALKPLGQYLQVAATRNYTNASQNELATFLYHAVHGVECGVLKVIDGSLPNISMEDFERFSSNIIISNHTNNSFQRKTLKTQIAAIRDAALV